MSDVRLVHGLAEELVPADWPAVTLDEVRPVLEAFGLAAAAVSWQSPRPLSAAALVATDGRTVFVKRHSNRVRTVAGLAEEHGFADHLRWAGVPVPEILRTPDGASALAVEDWTWEVHELGVGDDVYRETLSWQPFSSDTHAFNAGAALAELACAGESYGLPRRRPQPLVTSWTAICQPRLLDGLEQFVGDRPQLESALVGRDWRADAARVLAPLHASLAPLLGDLSGGWTHGDGHASNLLWGVDGRVSTVLDLGLADRTTPVLDLATAIERNGISWLDTRPAARLAVVDALVEGWVSRRPLSPVEAAALPELVPLVHTDFALSEVWYFDAITGSPGNASVAYDDYLLGHARWHADEPGRELHRHLVSVVDRLT